MGVGVREAQASDGSKRVILLRHMILTVNEQISDCNK